MSFATVHGAALHAVKQGRLLPHQLQAFENLDRDLTEEQKASFTADWRNDPAPAQPPSPPAPQTGDSWLTHALTIIKRWEGCRLTSYPDPGTGGDPWTIGWGTTRINGQPVRKGQTITQTQADALLLAEVTAKHQQVLRLLPMASSWRPEQVAAIVSFTFNVGVGALERSTLRRRLLAGEDPATVVRAELPRWNKGGKGQVMKGLVNRRADEVRLFVGVAPPPAAPPQPPAGKTMLRLTRTRKMDRRGLEELRLEHIRNGLTVGIMIVVSGAPGAQRFRKGPDSVAGSLEPLPQGRWRIHNIEWAGGKDNYNASWGAALGPASVPLTYLGPGTTRRSAIEIHLDANHGVAPGTAGCVGLNTMADLKTLVRWLRESDPKELVVDWNLP